jgi:CRP-like cAMP-binding protein
VRVTDLLRGVDLFASLSSAELEELARCARERHLEPGDVLCQTDRPCQNMFIVGGGSIELVAGGPARRLGTGDTFGETTIISGEPLRGTATAVIESRVVELARDDFEAFVAARPQVMRRILAAVSRRAVQTNQRLLSEQPVDRMSSTGRAYAVFSPRGGAGKTLVATRLAGRLVELMPDRVALMDLDLLFDDAALELDIVASTSLGSLQQPPDGRTMSSLEVEHASGLRVVVGATTPEEGERVSATHVREALLALKRQFLVTILDCGGTFSEPILAALDMSDRVLVLCTPELVSLRDVRECQRLFGQALHLEKNKLAYLFNHPSPTTGLTRRQFEDALEQRMLMEIPHAGESATKSGFARAIDQLAHELAPIGVKR